MKTFLIKASNGKEAVMRLPVNKHSGITTKGFKMIHNRFGVSLSYALNLEVYSTGETLIEAIRKYQNNTI